ncbi:hypothetical protein D7V96_26550, partial [bacterium D16-59]
MDFYGITLYGIICFCAGEISGYLPWDVVQKSYTKTVMDFVEGRQMEYKFKDFKTEQGNKTVIVDGKYGYKLKISIFNPSVPLYYKEQLLKM